VFGCESEPEGNKSKKTTIPFLLASFNYELNVVFDFHAPFENIIGIKFFFFDFDVYHGFLTKILPNFLYMSLFSQIHRPFFRHFANRAVASHTFEWKSTRKAFIVI